METETEARERIEWEVYKEFGSISRGPGADPDLEEEMREQEIENRLEDWKRDNANE